MNMYMVNVRDLSDDHDTEGEDVSVEASSYDSAITKAVEMIGDDMAQPVAVVRHVEVYAGA